MTQQERAQVAFKALGLYFLMLAAAHVPMIWLALGSYRESRETLGASPTDAATVLALMLCGALLMLVFGGVCLTAAERLARRLLPAVDPLDDMPREVLRFGLCLMGVLWLSNAGHLVLWFDGSGADVRLGPARAGLGAAVGGALAVACILRPRALAGVIGRFVGRGRHGVLAAGLCLVAAWWAGQALVSTSEAVVQFCSAPPYHGMEAGHWRYFCTQSLVNSAAKFPIALLLLLLARKVARFGAVREDEGAEGGAVRLGGTAVLALAVQVLVACLLVGWLRALAFVPSWAGRAVARSILLAATVRPLAGLLNALSSGALNAAGMASALVWAAAFPLVAVAAFLLLRRLAWPAARRMHRGPGPEAEAASPPLHLLLEVALAVLGSYHAVGFAASLRFPISTGGDVSLYFSVTQVGLFLGCLGALGLVAFKGDLAGLTVRDGCVEEPPRATRAALLQPWLVLLGAWLAIRDGARLAAWASAWALAGESHWWKVFRGGGAVLGLLLILAARPAARWLSFGPLLRHADPDGTD